MGIFVGFFMILFVVIVAFFVECIVGFPINKICLLFLAKKMNASKFGLLLIPGVSSWYEAGLLGRFVGGGKLVKIFLFINDLLLTATFLAFVIPGEFDDSISMVVSSLMFCTFALKAIFQSVAMSKCGMKPFVAVMINLFIQPFWSLFLIKRVKFADK